jgi:hypothetical protein
MATFADLATMIERPSLSLWQIYFVVSRALIRTLDNLNDRFLSLSLSLSFLQLVNVFAVFFYQCLVFSFSPTT